MKKRSKQSGSSDLRTSPISLNLHRYSNLPLLRAGSNSIWNVEHLQPFFPPIEHLFKYEKLESPYEYGIKFRDEIQSITSASSIRTPGKIENVHIKKTMLLSPFKWMQGDYGSTLGLPTTSEQAALIQTKLQSHHNAAYVGSLISALFSESGCQHFPKVYGIFSGTAKHHTIDISDDYPELCDRSWFSQNIGKTFELKLSESVTQSEFQHTRTARSALQLGEEVMLDGVQELEVEHVSSDMGELKKMFENEMEIEDDEEDGSSVSTSYIFGIHSCECEGSEDEDMEDMEDDGESFAWASFTNVPVHLTVMEACNGVFYDLMMCNPEEEKRLAWLAQVMFALAFAQRNFGFVHNDLHSNNIMYVSTEKEFLYYNLAGTLFKVPTYGYLIKIIDFERGVCSVKLNGMKDPKFFMSDHFSVNDEAGGQYNFPPFYNQKYPIIKPNPSFDLVRLATSLFWDFFPQGPAHEEYRKNPIFLFFTKWLTTEDGTSVLFGKEEPRHDRYHGFGLYKAIARYCRDNAVPRKEIMNLKMFYETNSVPQGETALVIDA
jgi:hypothetical protein